MPNTSAIPILESQSDNRGCVHQSNVSGSAALTMGDSDLAEVAGAGQVAVTRLDHAQLVALGISQHDKAFIARLTDIEVAAAESQHGRDRALLVLGAAAGQVQMEARAADGLSPGGDETEPDLRRVARYQRGAGLDAHLAVE